MVKFRYRGRNVRVEQWSNRFCDGQSSLQGRESLSGYVASEDCVVVVVPLQTPAVGYQKSATTEEHRVCTTDSSRCTCRQQYCILSSVKYIYEQVSVMKKEELLNLVASVQYRTHHSKGRGCIGLG